MQGHMTATLKYALSSRKKMNLVAKLVRGKQAESALTLLEYTPKKSAKILHKVVKSALSNATKAGKDPKSLYISRIEVGKWPSLGRIRFVGRSRVHRYEKHRSFVKVVLDVK